jgi:DNA-binding transcriptional ArsR family regulator
MSRNALEIAQVASLIGDVSRANILSSLMDGRALTALELSLAASVTPQTASSHLAKLTEANLLTVEKQGRHRYYRLSSPQVARTLEAVMALTAYSPPRYRASSKLDDELRTVRTCYDHLAGRIGVAISDALIDQGHVVFDGDAGEVTGSGMDFFAGMGLDLMAPTKGRRIFCRPCLDWSERRFHLAGRVGAAIASFCIERKWLGRKRDSRALTITREGERMLPRAFGIGICRCSTPSGTS